MKLNFISAPYRSFGTIRKRFAVNSFALLVIAMSTYIYHGSLRHELSRRRAELLDTNSDQRQEAIKRCRTELHALNEGQATSETARLSISRPRDLLRILARTVPSGIVLTSVRVAGEHVEFTGKAADKEMLAAFVSSSNLSLILSSSQIESTQDMMGKFSMRHEFVVTSRMKGEFSVNASQSGEKSGAGNSADGDDL